MPPTRQLVGNKILCPACLVKEKKIRRREENPWGSSTFFETPKYPRATDIRLLQGFDSGYGFQDLGDGSETCKAEGRK